MYFKCDKSNLRRILYVPMNELINIYEFKIEPELKQLTSQNIKFIKF